MQVAKMFRFVAAAFLCGVLAVAAHATTAVESVIYTFASDAPSPLIQAHDGNFYGTSPTGGSASHGYVFRLTTGGTRTVIYNFANGADGGSPQASLIEGNDGNLYGTNTAGGSGSGILFRMTLAGSITALHTFNGPAEGTRAGALTQTNAGDIFGAATTGGTAAWGTVFEYSHSGTFTVIHTFTTTGGDGGYAPTQLVQATDGYLYGSTQRGGSMNAGSLFRFNPAVAGSFATFFSFPPTGLSDPSYNPVFGMTEGQDGSLYGLTSEGGSTGYGSVYKVVPGASPAVTLNVHSFTSFSEGGLPASGLFLGGDGNFYGSTSSYGPGGPPNGTAFQYIPAGSGSLTTLYAFSSPDGNPTGAPIEAADSSFYGPAFFQVYKLVTMPTPPPPIALGGSSASITLGTTENLDWQVYNGYSETAANCWAHGDWSGSKTLTGTQSVTPAAVGTYHYALTCGGVESSSYTVVVTPAVSMQTATPVITPGTGIYTGPVEYNITDSSPGAVIHYTTDGTVASLASPVWDNTPKVLVSNTTVWAIAIAPGRTASNTTAAKFSIQIDPKRNCSIDYAKAFFVNTNLQLNHGASIASGILNMTHGLANENTSAFAKPRIPLSLFASEFHFRFYKATATSADGLTFTIQANSPNALGGPSSGLGYAGITHSMALKFDLHNNAGEGSNSVGLFFGGALPTTPAVDLTPSGINLHSSHILDAYVTYDTHHVILKLKDTVTAATFTHTFTVPASSPFGATTAYAGFTASTGALTSYAQVLDWTLESQGLCGKN